MAQAFQWTGINKQGARVQGVVHANDVKEAQVEIKKLDIEIITLKPKWQFKLFSKEKKVKPKEIMLFTRYLSTMLGAGLPLLQAMDIIARDQENPALKNVILSLKSNISGGKTLAESFSHYPHYFGSLYCNLIKAGENSGTLDKILKRLVIYLEKTQMIRQKIKKALIYPIAIMIVATAVSLILLIFVVPQFKAMFSSFGAPLPFFTRIVIALSEFFRSYWWVIILVIGIAVVAFKKMLKQNKEFHDLLDRWSLHLFIFGPVIQKGIIARFTRTLSTTLEAGMPIVEAMKSMVDLMGNKTYSTALLKICDDVRSGQQLNTSMAETKLFPNMVIQMVAIGETSGTLSDMMSKIADYYEDEVSQIVDNISSLLEPLIMAILGIIIGGFVIAMYLPIFKIGSLF